MPELPEVETVKNGLTKLLGEDAQIERIEVVNQNLRFPVPADISDIGQGKIIKRMNRRAKYLLFDLEDIILCSHLGMTGTWRLLSEKKKHDHIHIYLKDKRVLTFNDPRRFGFFEYFKKDESYHRFLHLGPEPLSHKFDFDYLWPMTRNKEVAIKNFIMNQEVVVGVGNIYAAESLFDSKIKPQRKSKTIKKEELKLLIKNIKKTLKRAIHAGGSTISDFKQAGGESGYFQHEFKVYDRKGEPCLNCQRLLKNVVLGGRASVYCPYCQK